MSADVRSSVLSPKDGNPRSGRLRGLGYLVWRQHRLALESLLAILAAFGLFMVLQGTGMHRDHGSLTFEQFRDRYLQVGQAIPRFVLFLPGLIGAFVGAPVVARELESGTYQFAWTQDRSRTVWLAAKLVILGVAVTALTLSFSWLYSWWASPFSQLLGRMQVGEGYEVAGVVFAARSLFALMLGVLLGTLIRRTVPAMAATLVLWNLIAWPTALFLRPLIASPHTVHDSPTLNLRIGWVLSTQGGPGSAVVTWLPPSSFWHLQSIEAAGYLLAAAACAGMTWWWFRRHIL